MVEDQSETSMVYINLPDHLARELASKSYADEDRACIPAVSGETEILQFIHTFFFYP